MRWSDVTFGDEEGEVVIRGTIVYAEGGGVIRQSHTKTGDDGSRQTGARAVYLIPEAVEMLQARADHFGVELDGDALLLGGDHRHERAVAAPVHDDLDPRCRPARPRCGCSTNRREMCRCISRAVGAAGSSACENGTVGRSTLGAIVPRVRVAVAVEEGAGGSTMLGFIAELFGTVLGGDGDLIPTIRSRHALKSFVKRGHLQFSAAVQAGGAVRAGFLRIDSSALRLSLDAGGTFRPVEWPLDRFDSYVIHPVSGSRYIPAASPVSSALELDGPAGKVLITYEGCYDAAVRRAMEGAGIRDAAPTGQLPDAGH